MLKSSYKQGGGGFSPFALPLRHSRLRARLRILVDAVFHRLAEVFKLGAGVEQHAAAFDVRRAEVVGFCGWRPGFQTEAEIAQFAYAGDAALGKHVLDLQKKLADDAFQLPQGVTGAFADAGADLVDGDETQAAGKGIKLGRFFRLLKVLAGNYDKLL